MAYKNAVVPPVGAVTFFKKKGIKNIRLTVIQGGVVRVSMPYWLPYSSAIPFVKSKSGWINNQKKKMTSVLRDGQRVGKAHYLALTPDNSLSEIKSKVINNQLVVSFPTLYTWEDESVQEAAKKIIAKGLKTESNLLLIRLKELSAKSGIDYSSGKTRILRTRWGSCNSKKEIVLNVYLISLPWELIDYVIMHELTHTRHSNHSPDFWKELERNYPNHKQYRREIKKFQPYGEVDEKTVRL